MGKLYNFLVKKLANSRLLEIADSRQEFYRTAKGLYFQILESAGCILYSFENRVSQENIHNWLSELCDHVHNLRRTVLKVSKKRILEQVLDTMNLGNRAMLREDLESRFMKERFKMEEFSDRAVEDLIHFMRTDFIEIACREFEEDCEWPRLDTLTRLNEAMEKTRRN